MQPALARSRWFSFARFDTREVDAWTEVLLQWGLRVPPDLDAVMKAHGLPRLPVVSTRSGMPVTGTLSLLSPGELFFRARTSASMHVQLGDLTTAGYGAHDGEEDEPELLLDAAGRYRNAGRWTTTLAALLAETDQALESLADVALEVDEEEERRDVDPAVSLAEVHALVARRLAHQQHSPAQWWRYDWRRVFHRHPDAAVAREILADIGNGHGATRGGSLVSVDDLVQRLPEAARRAWVVEELLTAGPPTAELAVALDELAEAPDARFPRARLERLVPMAWTDRAPTVVDLPTRWARALLLALGRPVADHLLHAVRLVHGPRESREQWERAVAFARAAQVL